jgi:hypothetical protein
MVFMAAPAGLFGIPARRSRQAVLFADSLVVIGLHFEVISDLSCPWCYIGKLRLDPLLPGTLLRRVTATPTGAVPAFLPAAG